jgi:adenylosuccinate synthase
MSVTVVVGGQYGSEGKGKVCSYLAKHSDLAVRSGGPNSGHTVVVQGETFKLRHVPSTFLNPDCRLALAAGTVIDADILVSEIERCGVADRLTVDPHAVVIDPDDSAKEGELGERIGSTMSGTGSAMARKVLRVSNIRLAKDVPELAPFLASVSSLTNEYVEHGARVLLEGSQGLGLSLHHGPFPYVTSRDTSPGTLCGEAGVSPLLVTDVILVLRTYPIRVAGNSGPLSNELAWEDVTRASGSAIPLAERTTVTNGLRRVGQFDWDVVRKSAILARPTQIALNFVDYIDANNYGASDAKLLSTAAANFVDCVERRLGRPVALLGTGPDVQHVIDRRSNIDSRPALVRVRD